MRNEKARRKLKIIWLRRHKVPQQYEQLDVFERDTLIVELAHKMKTKGFYSERSHINDITRGLPNLIEEATPRPRGSRCHQSRL